MFAWFAGIFYLPRLYVNWIENEDINIKKNLEGMSWRLLRFMTPMGVLAILFGLITVITASNSIQIILQKWLLIKILITILLLLYNFYLYAIYKKIISGNLDWSSKKMRLFNEIPAILLLVAIFSAVFKFL
jgi:putative membrane protein